MVTIEIFEIYIIKNTDRNIHYVGVTKNGYNRYRQHLRALKNNYHNNKKMLKHFSSGDAFEFEVIDICIGDERASELEVHHIKNYKETGLALYNLNEGGLNTNKGYKQSDYAKQVASEVHSKKIGELNSFYGRKHTKESREKMSRSLKGKRKGVKFSETHRRNLKMNNANSKKVIIDGVEYMSMSEAEKHTGISRRKIAKLAKDPNIKNIFHK